MVAKKYGAIAVILTICLCFIGAVKADYEPEAYYSVEGVYSAKTKTYTAAIYLNTTKYLSAGSFGMEYSFDTSLDIDFELNTENFADQTPDELKKYNSQLEANQVFLHWGMLDINEYTGKIPFATLTVNGVEPDIDGKPDGWDENSIHCLKWTDTVMAQDELFSGTVDDIDMNLEIWRSTTAEDRAADSTLPDGFYQGYAADDENDDQFAKWIDIGFVYTSQSSEYTRLKGSIHGYNPNFSTIVTAYMNKDDEWIVSDTAELTESDYRIYTDGQVDGEYIVRAKEPGEYKLVIQKNVHLTKTIYITVPEDVTEMEVEEKADLICGDINHDGRILYPDRVGMIRFLNYQLVIDNRPDEFKEADLNGDGKVSLFDLSILMQNMFKKY